VTAVVRDGRVADAALAGGADRRDLPAATELVPHGCLRLGGRRAPLLTRVEQPDAVPVDDHGDRRGGGPTSTIASWPVSLPAIAKWLLARASVSIPVSGLLATTANFALVVSGVPTSGEKTKAERSLGSRAGRRRRRELVQQPGAEPAPPTWSRSTRSGSGRTRVDPSVTSTTSARPK
jgi:hypothetical protein